MSSLADTFVRAMYSRMVQELAGAERMRKELSHREDLEFGFRMSLITRRNMYKEILNCMTSYLQGKEMHLKRAFWLAGMHKKQLNKLQQRKKRLPFLDHVNRLLTILRSQKTMMNTNRLISI